MGEYSMMQDRSPPPITLGTKLFYGFGSIAYGVKDQGFAYLLLIYYNQVLHLPAAQVGFAILIVLMIDAFLDPLIGQWSDMVRSRWGRRHPFMYGTALPVSLCYVLLWSPPSNITGPALFWYLIIVATLIRALIALYEIPSSALAPELTSDYHERTTLLGYRQLFGWLGGLTMAILAFGVFLTPDATHPIGQLNPAGYAHYGWTAAVLMFLAIVISAAGTHRRIPYLVTPPSQPFAPLRLLRDMLAMISHRSLLMLFCAGLFSGTAIGLSTSLTYYMLTYFWGMSSFQIFLLLFANIISAVVGPTLATRVSRRLGGKKHAAILLWSMTLVVGPLPLLARLAGLMPENGSSPLLGILFVHSAIWISLFIGTATLVASMVADVVEERQVTTGKRAEGLLFAANSFIQKFTSGIGVYASGILLSLIHFPENAKPGGVDVAILDNMAILFTVLTTVLFFIAIFFISSYRINRQTHEANVQRLAEGRVMGGTVVQAAFASRETAGRAPLAGE
jgi:Na+/melibiose symporter-like transporter